MGVEGLCPGRPSDHNWTSVLRKFGPADRPFSGPSEFPFVVLVIVGAH